MRYFGNPYPYMKHIQYTKFIFEDDENGREFRWAFFIGGTLIGHLQAKASELIRIHTEFTCEFVRYEDLHRRGLSINGSHSIDIDYVLNCINNEKTNEKR